MRTLFHALHHLRPEAARGVLADAAAARQPLVACAVMSRHPAVVASTLLVAAAVPFLRPFRLAWLPLTDLLPIIPLFVAWDGFVSCLRVHSAEELRELAGSASTPGYSWEIGSVPAGSLGIRATYLLGPPSRP